MPEQGARIAALIASAEEAATRMLQMLARFERATLDLDAGAVATSGAAIESAWASVDAMSRLALVMCAGPGAIAVTARLERLRHCLIDEVGRRSPILSIDDYAGQPIELLAGDDVAAFLAERVSHTLAVVARACAILEEPPGPERDTAAKLLLDGIEGASCRGLFSMVLGRRGLRDRVTRLAL
jgi:hypothetical protein